MATRPGPPKPPPGAPLSSRAAISPNQTIYVSNLNDKLPKTDLRLHLYMLFSTYGPVLDIVALKTPKMRGQAHVTFRDLVAAQQAMLACQGMEFFGKNMNIQFAKSKSDKLKKLDGTYHMPTKSSAVDKSTDKAQETEERTDLQRAIFDRAAGAGPLPPAPGLPPKPNFSLPVPAPALPRVSPTPEPAKGQKRPLEPEPEEEEEDVPMDMDDEGSAMEESDED